MKQTMGSAEIIICDFCRIANVINRLTGLKLPYIWKGWAVKDGKDICPECIDRLREEEKIQKRIDKEIDSINRNFDFNNPLFKAASLKPIMNYYLIAVMAEITNVRAKIITIYKKSASIPTRSDFRLWK